MKIIQWLLTKHIPKSDKVKTDMTISVSLTIADVAKIVNDNPEIKAAVLAKHLEENAPELVIQDLPQNVPADVTPVA